MAAKKTFTKVTKTGASDVTALLPSVQAAAAQGASAAPAAPRPKHPVSGKALFGHHKGDGKDIDEIISMKDSGTYTPWAKTNVDTSIGENTFINSAVRHRRTAMANEAERGRQAQAVAGGEIPSSLAPVMDSVHPLLVEYRARAGTQPTYRTIPAPKNGDGTRNKDFDHIGYLNTLGGREIKISALYTKHDPGTPKFEGLPPEERTTPEGQAEHKRLFERHEALYGEPRAVSVTVGKRAGSGMTRAQRALQPHETRVPPSVTQGASTIPPYITTQRSQHLASESQEYAERTGAVPGRRELTVQPATYSLHPHTEWLLDAVRNGQITTHEAARIHRKEWSDEATGAIQQPPVPYAPVVPRAGAESMPPGVVHYAGDLDAIAGLYSQYSSNVSRERGLERSQAHRTAKMNPQGSLEKVASETGWYQGPRTKGSDSESEAISALSDNGEGGFQSTSFGSAGSARKTAKSNEGIVHIRNEQLYGSYRKGTPSLPSDNDPDHIGRLSADPDVVGAYRVASWAKAILTGDDAHLDDVHSAETRLGFDGAPNPHALPSDPQLEYTVDPGQMVAARHLVGPGESRDQLEELAAKRIDSAKGMGAQAGVSHPVHQDIQSELDGTNQDGRNFLHKMAEEHGVDPNEGHANEIMENARRSVLERSRFDIGLGDIGIPPEVASRSNMMTRILQGPRSAPTAIPRPKPKEIRDPDTGEVLQAPSNEEARRLLDEAAFNKTNKLPNSARVQDVVAHAARPTANAEEHDAYHAQVRGRRRALVQKMLRSSAADSLFTGGVGQREAVVASSSAINETRDRSERGAAASGADLAGLGGVPR